MIYQYNMEKEKITAEQLVNDAGKKELLQMSEISLILDTYDDIFSDFDPRPYSERALSDDFLLEAKKATKDREKAIELTFMIPKNIRDAKSESLVKRRLREHFKRHHDLLHKDMRNVFYQGLSFVASGIILMLIATIILSKNITTSFITNFLIIIMEPGGWFLFWEGLNILIFESKKIKPELSFYEKMSKCEVRFVSY